MSYLNRPNIRILSSIFVLVEAIFGKLSLSQIDTEANEKKHDRLERGDGTVSCSFGDDMFVE